MIDYDTLPTALLPEMKQHLRVVITDEDALITDYLRWAIDYRQHVNQQQLFTGTVEWTPDTTASRAQCPVQPVSDFVVMSGVIDVSAEYELEQESSISPVYLAKIDGTAFHADAIVTLTVGMTTLPPAEKGNVFRIAATLYEHRESVTSLDLEQIPMWLNDSLGAMWIPRA